MKNTKKAITILLFAVVLTAFMAATAPDSMAVNETIGTIQQGIWINPSNITFSLDATGPCGSTAFVLLNSNALFWQIYTALLVARSESTVVDVVSSSCYSENTEFTVVEWMKLGN